MKPIDQFTITDSVLDSMATCPDRCFGPEGGNSDIVQTGVACIQSVARVSRNPRSTRAVSLLRRCPRVAPVGPGRRERRRRCVGGR